jgi:uncharacterized membrane protein
MVLRITKITIIFFIGSLIIFSCYNDNEEEVYPTESVCDTTSLTYDTGVSEIFSAKCAIPACHGGNQSPDFSQFSNISSNITRIKTRAIDQKSMPPSSATPLSDCEIQKLEAWIANGSPQN